VIGKENLTLVMNTDNTDQKRARGSKISPLRYPEAEARRKNTAEGGCAT
jgi:hypothetical protein